jgi:predicted amidohydrolase YtcJ
MAPELVWTYRYLRRSGEQTVRAVYPLSLPPYRTAREASEILRDWSHLALDDGAGDSWLKPSGVYIEYGGYDDVAWATQAAWPYTGWAGFGAHVNDAAAYREICTLAATLGIRVATVIKTTLSDVLDVWEEVNRRAPIGGLRWVLAHGHVITQRDLRRIAALGAVLTTQPASYLYRSGLETVRKGARPGLLLAHRAYLEAGVHWAMSTDNKPYSPWFALWVAVAREEMTEGRVLSATQRVSFRDALAALTTSGAYLSNEEHRRGGLGPGMLADLAVLSDDPEAIAPDRLPHIRSSMTVVGGTVVHHDGALKIH